MAVKRGRGRRGEKTIVQRRDVGMNFDNADLHMLGHIELPCSGIGCQLCRNIERDFGWCISKCCYVVLRRASN